MPDPRSLARHLRQCYALNDRPRTEAADAKLWFLALEDLIHRGALSEAAHAAPHLVTTFPGSVFLGRLAMLLDRMPAPVADPAFAVFADRSGDEVRIVPRPGATTALLAFCGRHGALGMPLPIAHRWFGELGVHVVYLRDPSGGVCSAGLPSLGHDRATTVGSLREAVEGLGATRILCYGNSNGGYAALLYGLELDAASVLATNAVTLFPEARIAARFAGRPYPAPAELPDVACLYAVAARRPRACLVYGAGNVDDTASAERMTGIPDVCTLAVPDCDGHDAHVALVERGRFGSLLRGFAAEWPELEGPAAG